VGWGWHFSSFFYCWSDVHHFNFGDGWKPVLICLIMFNLSSGERERWAERLGYPHETKWRASWSQELSFATTRWMLDWNMFHEEIMPLDHVGIADLESESSTCQFEHGLGFVTRWAGKTCVVLPRWGLKPETKIIRGGYDEWTTNDIDYVHYYQAGPATMHLPFHGPEDFTTDLDPLP
jgi:hypothetical protein